MKPTASAPIATASSASSSLVIPQIFTNISSPRAVVPPGTATLALAGSRERRAQAWPPRLSSAATRHAAASPTSTASKPASARRAHVVGVADPRLGDRDDPGRDRRGDPHRPLGVDLEGVQVALVHPDRASRRRRAPARARPRRAPRRGRPGRAARASEPSSSSSGCESAATMSSTASAPIARASRESAAHTVKSFRSTGRPVAARAARRSAALPAKYASSVSTDRHAAPPLVVVGGELRWRRAAGARSPFEGERRFTSAITATPSAASTRSKGRGGGAVAAAASRSASGRASAPATRR